jgi:hypothetical protein
MPELLERAEKAASMAGMEATAVPESVIGLEGWPSLLELEQSRLYMDDGPTGWSAYWPEYFAFVHPDLATTDSALNGVDVIWLPKTSPRLHIWLELTHPPLPPVGEIVQRIRAAVDLPVAQVAAMCGIKRRQFYNLLDGRGASATRERWVRALADAVEEISDAANGGPDQVRAAVLRPVDGASFFDAACAGDYDKLRDVALRLSDLLRTGGLPSHLRRPVLRSRRQGNARRATEFLAEYRDGGEDDGGQ